MDKNDISNISINEKAQACAGVDCWSTRQIEGIKSIRTSDGPHGLRKQPVGNEKTDLGINDSILSTCFPPAALTSATFNRRYMAAMGEAIAIEAIALNVDVVLGPGLNIKRTPLNGRNFEYVSEDPYLAAEYGKAFVQGIQSKGIGACIKHFACNNQESYRMIIDACVDKRALREIYLYAFEQIIKFEQPYAIMASYNRLNGEWTTQNAELLTDILRKEWGYKGLVMSDWSAINNRVLALKAGCDLEMPYSGEARTREILQAVKNKESGINEALDASIMKLKELSQKCQQPKPIGSFDKDKHHALCRTIAQEGMVLLKNDGILPFKATTECVGVIGEFAKIPRYQGGGSSHINPTAISDCYSELIKRGVNVDYERGYDIYREKVKARLIKRAVDLAGRCKIVLLFVGLTDFDEYEGMDRKSTDLCKSQLILIDEVCKVNKNVIVVLCGGSAIALPWIDKARALLYTSVSGQAGAEATADILIGMVNPSGKLTETFPLVEDNPFAKQEVLGGNNAVYYKESIYVGYRYFDKLNKKVAFPFGFGLSYTTFEFKNFAIALNKRNATVSLTIKNTGNYNGAEVAQVYIGHETTEYFTAKKQLKGFEKVFLNCGECKKIEINLDFDAFKHYDTINGWQIDNGIYTIMVGNSSQNIIFTKDISIINENICDDVCDNIKNTAETNIFINDYFVNGEVDFEKFKAIYEKPLPPLMKSEQLFDENSVGEDIKKKWLGRLMMFVSKLFVNKANKGNQNKAARVNLIKGMDTVPLRCLAVMSGGILDYGSVKHLVSILNKKNSIIKGFIAIKKEKKYK
ncbi:MAG: glycoside hydrolase family 3 C-terminal domain-containing protein [Clostridia bacterium]